MTLNSFFKEQISLLKTDLHQDLEFLILETLNVNKLDLYSKERSLSEADEKLLVQKIDHLKLGKPLAYILKSQNFFNHLFYVDERVLIPRSETEWMLDYVLKASSNKAQMVFDAGAGSGCLGIGFLLNSKDSFCVFMENSKPAIEVLKINLDRFKIKSDRYLIVENFEDYENSSFFKNIKKIDLFISNPPYIALTDTRLDGNVKAFEPHAALFAEDSGLYYLKNWSKKAINYLNPKTGWAIFEFGLGQELILQTYGNDHKMDSEIILDQYQKPRFWKIKGIKNGSN